MLTLPKGRKQAHEQRRPSSFVHFLVPWPLQTCWSLHSYRPPQSQY